MKYKTNVQENEENLTIAELISKAKESEANKNLLSTELSNILSKLPLPKKSDEVKSKLQEAYWNLDIELNSQEFLHVGQTKTLASNYFEQEIIIPTENKENIKVKLYLNCFSCSGEALNGL